MHEPVFRGGAMRRLLWAEWLGLAIAEFGLLHEEEASQPQPLACG